MKIEYKINVVLESAIKIKQPLIDIGLLQILLTQRGYSANIELESVKEDGNLIFLSAPKKNQIEATNEG